MEVLVSETLESSSSMIVVIVKILIIPSIQYHNIRGTVNPIHSRGSAMRGQVSTSNRLNE